MRLEAALDELRGLLGDRLVTSRSVLDVHGRDESPLPAAPPDAVAYPNSTEDVVKVMQVCNRHRVPVIPFGVGTSLEGHVLATSGGVSLDMTNMNEILAVRVDDMDATVQPGVTRKTLNERLARDGLFFPVDPGADATLGGMAATNASGTTTVRYGAMRENVVALKVVLADGRVIETAHRARKTSAGYDLTHLFVGSEGTLGVITEVTLRVFGIPEAISAAICTFPNMEKAVRAVTATLQMGVPVARIEFLDESAIEGINRYSGTSYPIAPLLFLEFHGSHDEVADQTRYVGESFAEFGATDFRSAVDNKERAELWRARHDLFYASLGLRPGSRAVTTDVCVPISRLPECILATKEDITELGLLTTIGGHVGDGNFHVMVLLDPDDATELKAAEEMNHRLVERALKMDGTCTGEHGIGLRKVEFLPLELPGGVEVMRQIKRALDPNNILNPGKVVTV
jgi:D-lactate dehydrogenase (cytochrome)